MEPKKRKRDIPSTDPREELAELIIKKAAVTETLLNLERQIYAFEGSYLYDTANFGNVVRGWKGIRNSQSDYQPFHDSERLFSISSGTSLPAATGISGEYAKRKIIPSEDYAKFTSVGAAISKRRYSKLPKYDSTDES